MEMSRGFLYDAEIRCEDVSSTLTCFYTYVAVDGGKDREVGRKRLRLRRVIVSQISRHVLVR